MSSMTPKQRVIAALEMKPLDRPPVVCFTQAVTVDVMEAAKVFWPDAHTDAKKMAELSAAIPKVTGMECVRLPYCLTVEAEIMGCQVDLGKLDRTPMVKKHGYEADSEVRIPADVVHSGRAKTVVEAIKLLKKMVGKEYPIVVGTTGPLTIAGHLVGTENLLLWMITDPEPVKKFIKISAELERKYIKALADAGADVIVMSDPSASTDMLSAEMFDEFAKPAIKEAFADAGKAKTVLHICGDTTILLDHMIATGADGLSIEEKVSPEKAVELVAGRAALVGNIGVVRPLLRGTPEDCEKEARRVKKAGFNLVAPGCGLAARVPLANIQAMVKGVKN
ncbi:MAG TPA: MtaA/CmuA family methyltransferase [Methanomassiliicoccales archaeon]|nr:MtaA/CmuA family methyltransferase [Methanomassiliicoccales archaeon]